MWRTLHSRAVVMAALLAMIPPGLAGQPPRGADKDAKLAAIVTQGEATRVRARMAQVLAAAAIQLHVSDREMPRIVLLQSEPSSAAVAGVPVDGEVLAQKVPGVPGRLYLAWLVGDITDCKLADAAVAILNDAYTLGLEPSAARNATRQLCGRLGSVVSVESLLGKQR